MKFNMCHASVLELSVMKSKLHICKRFNTHFPSSVVDTHFDCLSTTGMTEPAYKEQEFVTPTKARRTLIRNWFESKYRNMWWLSCNFIMLIMLCVLHSCKSVSSRPEHCSIGHLFKILHDMQIKLISSSKELQVFSIFMNDIFAYGSKPVLCIHVELVLIADSDKVASTLQVPMFILKDLFIWEAYVLWLTCPLEIISCNHEIISLFRPLWMF